jgi:uncharacterized membrane protein
MYSKVKIGKHPLHPMLVGFPITFYTVTFLSFLAYALGAEQFWFRVAVYANLAGVLTALVAAVPGFIDWSTGVPTGSPAKATGMRHMIFNVSALTAFAINVALRWNERLDTDPEAGISVFLTGLGFALTGAAGALGWRMVQTHHVGVDLTPEQERLEPRVTPREEQHGPAHGDHGAAIR